jgi:hypothetical protein
MRLFGWFASQRTTTRLSSLAHIVAEQCRESVWHRVAHRAGSLRSTHEAGGYIRSRARHVILRKTRLITLQRPLPTRVEQYIWQTALDLLVARLSPHLVARPAESESSRRAA